MKKLLLIRHAKSSWDYKVEDHNRPLMEKGIARAKRMATVLAHQDLDLGEFSWFSSPANRALHTAVIFASKFELTNRIQIKPELYTFSFTGLMQAVQAFSNQHHSVVVFGHNEAFTDFANQMGSRRIDNIPTASAVMIKFDANNWSELKSGRTIFYLNPKEYEA